MVTVMLLISSRVGCEMFMLSGSSDVALAIMIPPLDRTATGTVVDVVDIYYSDHDATCFPTCIVIFLNIYSSSTDEIYTITNTTTPPPHYTHSPCIPIPNENHWCDEEIDQSLRSAQEPTPVACLNKAPTKEPPLVVW